jgi:hypothetical protein
LQNDRLNDKLRDPHSSFDQERLVPTILQYYPNLSPIVGVYDSAVDAYATSMRKARTRLYMPVGSFGKLENQPGTYCALITRGQHKVRL